MTAHLSCNNINYHIVKCLVLFNLINLLVNAGPSINYLRHEASYSQHGVMLDIHIPLRLVESLCPFDEAVSANGQLKKIHDEQIDFTFLHTPHITLYLASFQQDKIRHLIYTLRQTIPSLDPCSFLMRDTLPYHSGYTIFEIQNSDCLQKMSDRIVNATSKYIYRPPTIPSWVFDLPEPDKSIKINLSLLYGSPNVFDGFRPHVTVAFFSNSTETQLASIQKIWGDIGSKFHNKHDKSGGECQGITQSVALGISSIGGSVLKQSLIEFHLPSFNGV